MNVVRLKLCQNTATSIAAKTSKAGWSSANSNLFLIEVEFCGGTKYAKVCKLCQNVINIYPARKLILEGCGQKVLRS